MRLPTGGLLRWLLRGCPGSVSATDSNNRATTIHHWRHTNQPMFIPMVGVHLKSHFLADFQFRPLFPPPPPPCSFSLFHSTPSFIQPTTWRETARGKSRCSLHLAGNIPQENAGVVCRDVTEIKTQRRIEFQVVHASKCKRPTSNDTYYYSE